MLWRKRQSGWVRRVSDILTVAAILGAILLVATVVPPNYPTEYEGTARVLDGDSIVVAGHETRLAGIDAPEHGQTCTANGAEWACGAASRDALRALIRSATVSCKGEARDDFGRVLAVFRAEETELNEWLVASGWAVAYGRYRDAEAAASGRKLGLWRGEFVRPSDWREANRE